MAACGRMLYMYEGEYEGECVLPEGHDADRPVTERQHYDAVSTWRTDADGYADHDTVDEDDSETVATVRAAARSERVLFPTAAQAATWLAEPASG